MPGHNALAIVEPPSGRKRGKSMNEKIKKHIEMLFTAAPKTRKALDMKEEMTQNTIEKYEDLLSEGYASEDAYQTVINSIGDVTELFEDLEEKNPLCLTETDRRKKAMLTAIAVGFYIFAGVVLLTFTLLEDSFILTGARIDFSLLGLVLAGVICIAPTCMLVYAANMYPNYQKKEDNLVENYKESKHASNRDKAIRTSVSAIIWTLTIVLYFLVSFKTSAWYVTWVIFLIGACVQAVVELIISLKTTE